MILPPPSRNSYNKGFTLAEVLIALVIIGVISAITISSLIQNTQKQEFVSSLKKTYSVLSQVTNQIIAEEGSPKGDNGWADSSEHVYELFKTHLNMAKECSNMTSDCMPQGTRDSYKKLNGSSWAGWSLDASPTLILADGTQVSVHRTWVKNLCNLSDSSSYGYTEGCAVIFVDLNGVKGPNTAGRDSHTFILKENGLYPSGCGYEDKCRKEYAGYACTCKVMQENAMNY